MTKPTDADREMAASIIWEMGLSGRVLTDEGKKSLLEGIVEKRLAKLERLMTEVEKGQQVAGHHPSPDALSRARRVATGETSAEDAFAEVDAKYQSPVMAKLEAMAAENGWSERDLALWLTHPAQNPGIEGAHPISVIGTNPEAVLKAADVEMTLEW